MNGALHDLICKRLALLPFSITPDQLLARDTAGGLGPPGKVSANGSCRILRAIDGWVALNLARADDRDIIPALTGGGGDWEAVRNLVQGCGAADFIEAAAELQLPVARLAEAAPVALAGEVAPAFARVLDISALWAGPLCSGLLALSGAQVLKIESRTRPDPTAVTSPRLDNWLNGAKERLRIDLSEPGDRKRLTAEAAAADIIVTSARPAALERLGLTPAIFDIHPSLIWIAITAHGWAVDRVGFGDDCAVAGGLVRYEADEPRFVGDAIADPLTGLEAALWALERFASRQGGLVNLPLAGVAAHYAQEVEG